MTAIYTRQSVDRADSISVELQADACRQKLTADELAGCKIYTDKGFSGKNTNRPALQQLLQDVKSGQIGKILVYKLDRISRSVHDFTGLCQLLAEKGVQFQSVADNLTLDDSLSGTVMAQIMMVFAQFERETVQRRVTDSYFGRAKTGMYLGGRPPFGFVKGETTIGGKRTACYLPHSEQTAIVMQLYGRYVKDGESLYLQGKGATLNDPIGEYRGVRGCYCYALFSSAPPEQKPSRSKFSQMERSFITLAPHEGLVSAGLWLAAQHKLDQNRALKNSGAGSHSWLSGLMRCGHCGYAISVVNKPNGMGGHYINCGGHKRGNAVCPGRRRVTTLEEIEIAVERQLLPFLASYREVRMQEKRPCSAEVNRLEMQLVGLEEELQKLTRNLGQITEPDVVQILSRRIHAVNGERETLVRRRDALLLAESQPDLERYFQAVLDEWLDYGIPARKRIAKAAIARVTVGDGTVAVVFRAPYGKQKA